MKSPPAVARGPFCRFADTPAMCRLRQAWHYEILMQQGKFFPIGASQHQVLTALNVFAIATSSAVPR